MSQDSMDSLGLSGMGVDKQPSMTDSELGRQTRELLEDIDESQAVPIGAAAVVAAADETGVCQSSNGGSSGEEEYEEEEEEEEDIAGFVDKGEVMLQKFASVGASQDSVDDDGDYDEERIRDKEFGTIKTATWAKKKIDAKTVELNDLMQKHTKSHKELIAPVKSMINSQPSHKAPLKAFVGLLSEASTNINLRQMIYDVAASMKGQEDILDQIKYHVKVIAVGEVIHREKLEEEAAKNGDTSALMTAAAELIQSNSAGPSTSSEKRRVSSDKASSKKAKASK